MMWKDQWYNYIVVKDIVYFKCLLLSNMICVVYIVLIILQKNEFQIFKVFVGLVI